MPTNPRHPNFDLAIFDLDGTLIHMNHDFFFEQALSVIKKLGYPHLTRADLEGCAFNNDFYAFVPQDSREEFRHAFHELFDESAIPPAQPFDGALDALDHLASQGLHITIATARKAQAHELRVALAHTGFLKYVSIITTRGPQIRSWVDKAEQILSICHELQIEPQRAFMVGDAPIDITSAKKVGMGLAIALLSGGMQAEILHRFKPDLLLPDVTHLREHLPQR